MLFEMFLEVLTEKNYSIVFFCTFYVQLLWWTLLVKEVVILFDDNNYLYILKLDLGL